MGLKQNRQADHALRIATALKASCQAFISNDRRLQRATEIRVFVLDEFEPDC